MKVGSLVRQGIENVRSLYYWLLSVWMFPFSKEADWSRVRLFGLLLHLEEYVIRWGIIFFFQWLLVPRWLVESGAGLQTMFQVIPAVTIALLVLVVASTFTIAQLAVSGYGSRAALLLLEDGRLQGLFLRPLFLLVGALLLSGSVPDAGKPDGAITAAATTIAMATIAAAVGSVVVLPPRLIHYTAPRNFTLMVLEEAEGALRHGFTDPVVYRLPLLGEMLRACIRRGDSVGLLAGLSALERIQMTYSEVLTTEPQIGRHKLDDGSYRERWFVEEFRLAHVSAGEEALRIGTPEKEADAISGFLTSSVITCAKARQEADATYLAEGLVQLSVSSHQVSPRTVNLYAKPGGDLPFVETAAEENRLADLATFALAGWLLAMSYPEYHFGAKQHPLWAEGIRALGPRPPWDAAAALVQSEPWQIRWANKQYQGPRPVLKKLKAAKREHSRRAPN